MRGWETKRQKIPVRIITSHPETVAPTLIHQATSLHTIRRLVSESPQIVVHLPAIASCACLDNSEGRFVTFTGGKNELPNISRSILKETYLSIIDLLSIVPLVSAKYTPGVEAGRNKRRISLLVFCDIQSK